MGDARHMKRASRIVFSVFTAIALLYLIYFMPLPLYIFKPGTADVIEPMVQVEQSAAEDKGQFMLTTVAVSDATVYGYLMSFIRPYQELRLKEDLLRRGETETEYTQRQAVVMMTSQADAIQAVYNKLNIPYRINHDGVVIEHIYPDFPAQEVLRAGDNIVKIDDKPIATADELRSSLANKKVGDTVAISYKRGNVTRTDNVALAVLPSEETSAPAPAAEPQRAGLGIVPVEVHSIQAESEDKQVAIKAGNIGGPSAGLMFSLEIFNRFVPEDISKGYKIAGTGEIDRDGNVRVIGGIKHKIVAADRVGADIFFSPKDYRTPDGRTIPNYSDAKQRAEEIGTDMTIVPVGTLDEALQYLAGLPVKPSS
ncbi:MULTISPECIES: SepM family pheromone-processing serine protease [unclassified Paenibacillus]|uniref:SepM family pheromone-processing serine protease n=1 Tax=unclassified Paenibacillus TaxID=185978 RepID=UPI001AE5FB32|nr:MULTISPECIES: SepM family pheromone-processing serine protease [unclassified Paenibacillus]MBP1156056.1 PDZ domain-containing protein [Paenibacillus sp. PvP091]MBP1168558.1 PDZ domain-containing protein [Paenibacillus sp. PvR098]MBP2439586.1 PDZ domain-containing protein [Paenibacillus sp. PvP052]